MGVVRAVSEHFEQPRTLNGVKCSRQVNKCSVDFGFRFITYLLYGRGQTSDTVDKTARRSFWTLFSTKNDLSSKNKAKKGLQKEVQQARNALQPERVIPKSKDINSFFKK